MTLGKLIEVVKKQHPNAGETQIKLWLNQAQKEVSDRTNLGEVTTSSFNTVSGTKYYDFSSLADLADNDDMLSLTKVSYDGEQIQFLRNPEHIEGF